MSDLLFLMRIYRDGRCRFRILWDFLFDAKAFGHRAAVERRFYNQMLSHWVNVK